MKVKPILMAGLLALPLGIVASAQEQTTQQKKTEQQTTTTTNPDGTTQTESKTSEEFSTVNGKVQAYEAGHSITLVGDNGETTTYTIDTSSQVPKTIAVGKTVTVKTYSVSGSPMVKSVTMTTRTTTTKKKSY